MTMLATNYNVWMLTNQCLSEPNKPRHTYGVCIPSKLDCITTGWLCSHCGELRCVTENTTDHHLTGPGLNIERGRPKGTIVINVSLELFTLVRQDLILDALWWIVLSVLIMSISFSSIYMMADASPDHQSHLTFGRGVAVANDDFEDHIRFGLSPPSTVLWTIGYRT